MTGLNSNFTMFDECLEDLFLFGPKRLAELYLNPSDRITDEAASV